MPLPSFAGSDFTTGDEEQWFLGVFITLKNEWNKARADQGFTSTAQYFAEWDEDHALFLSTFYPKIYRRILKDNPLGEYYPQPESSRWHKVMQDNPDFRKRFQQWRNGEPRLRIYPATPEETELARERRRAERKERYRQRCMRYQLELDRAEERLRLQEEQRQQQLHEIMDET
jgi:hypothetical protein